MQKLFEDNAGLEAKTVFEFLQRQDPGRFQDGQVRTLQRRVKVWRATAGPARERRTLTTTAVHANVKPTPGLPSFWHEGHLQRTPLR